MRNDLESRLAEKFPFMRKKEQPVKGRIDDIYSAFGCECGDGWYDIIYNLCTEIEGLYESENEPMNIEVVQIKEKFGTLRFYYHPGDYNTPDFGDKLYNIIHRWEERSESVCEKCGKPGKLRNNLPWIRTLCDDCYKEQQQESK